MWNERAGLFARPFFLHLKATMGYLSDLKKKIEAMNVESIAQEAVGSEDSEQKIVQLQRQQLMSGYGADGKRLGEYRNEQYAEEKHLQNPEPGFPFKDLYKTGGFQSKIVANVVGDELIIESTDDKADEVLRLTQNKHVFGLNEDSRQEYLNETLRPNFKKLIETATGLKYES